MEVIRLKIKKDIRIKGAKVLILGVTFKENCPDIRNSKVFDIINTLKGFEMNITILDPYANSSEVKHNVGINSIKFVENYSKEFDTIILAVAHDAFLKMDLSLLANNRVVIYDVKGILPKNIIDASL